jgi:hypothetical protein
LLDAFSRHGLVVLTGPDLDSSPMPLPWDDRKSVFRLTGIAEELLVSSRTAGDPASLEAVGRQLAPLSREIHALLAANDGALADEFERVVVRPEDALPVDVRAAMLVGWLRASNAVEAADEERRAKEEMSAAHAAPRKRTIGFRLRSVIGGEPTAGEEDKASGPPPSSSA